MAVESCPVTQTSQIWKHHYQWNSCTLTWSAENKDRCTHFLNGPAALTLKLIFILYSTPSFRTKACFLKASRSPVSNNKHRQINIRSKPSLQHFLISSVIRTSAIDSFIHAILSLSRWSVFANFANLLSRDPSCVVSWLFGQAAVTIIMVLDFIKLLPQERPTGHADGGTWTSWTVAVDSSPPSAVEIRRELDSHSNTNLQQVALCWAHKGSRGEQYHRHQLQSKMRLTGEAAEYMISHK